MVLYGNQRATVYSNGGEKCWAVRDTVVIALHVHLLTDKDVMYKYELVLFFSSRGVFSLLSFLCASVI